MIQLVLEDVNQLTVLELELIAAQLEYERVPNPVRFGFVPPYLIVHGVPLDEEHSYKYIRERVANG